MVQIWLGAVESGEFVAQATGIRRQALWVTEAFEQQVGGGVVAEGDGGFAEFVTFMGTPPTRGWMTSEYGTVSKACTAMRRLSCSCPWLNRDSTRAAARNLNVLHIGKRSSPRQAEAGLEWVSKTEPPAGRRCRFLSAVIATEYGWLARGMAPCVQPTCPERNRLSKRWSKSVVAAALADGMNLRRFMFFLRVVLNGLAVVCVKVFECLASGFNFRAESRNQQSRN